MAKAIPSQHHSAQDYGDKNTYDLTIAGLPFRLKSSHNLEIVQRLVTLVEEKMQEALQNSAKSGSLQNAAVLAALNLAEELVLLKQRALQEIHRIEEGAHKIARELENSKLGPTATA